jgi:cytochrome c
VLVGAPPGPGRDLLQKNNCTTACHAIDKKVVGPAYFDVALRYRADPGVAPKLAAKVKAGGTGVWDPYMPMTPNPQVTDADMKAMIAYILALKPPAGYKPAPLAPGLAKGAAPAPAPAAAPAKK